MQKYMGLLAILIGICAAFLGDAAFAATAAAAVFDPDTATRGYLDTLQGAAREKSDAYFEGGYWLILWGTLVAVIIDWLFLKFRWSANIRDLAVRIAKWKWLQPGLYILPYTLIGWLLTLPWTLYTEFYREKEYDLMNLTLGGWFSEALMGLLMGLVGAFIFTIILFAVIRAFPKNWWILGTGVTLALLMFVVMISPVYISPLFNDYTEMEDGPLRDDIVAMAQAADVPAENIYVFDQSKQHDRISANVSGFAGTQRISLNDNLLNRSTPEEVKAVMGHELGHYVLGHVWRIIIVLGLIVGLGLFILARYTPRLITKHGEKWGITSTSDPAVIPLFGIIMSLYFLAMTPVTNSLIRINESEADMYGLNAAREPEGFASIAMKLSEYRKIEPGVWEEMLFFDHPSGATRVRMAMDWKADHLYDASPETEAEEGAKAEEPAEENAE